MHNALLRKTSMHCTQRLMCRRKQDLKRYCFEEYTEGPIENGYAIAAMSVNAEAKGNLQKLMASSLPLRKKRGMPMLLQVPVLTVENTTVSGSVELKVTEAAV